MGTRASRRGGGGIGLCDLRAREGEHAAIAWGDLAESYARRGTADDLWSVVAKPSAGRVAP